MAHTHIIKNNLPFLIPYAILWCIALVFLLITGKIESHLILNSYHPQWADTFFRYYTELGGWIPIIFSLILLLFRYRMAIVLLLSQVVTCIITTALKYIFLAPRPSVFLANAGVEFPIVEGVKLHPIYSFPSGHTSTAFTLFFALAIFCPHKWQKVCCLILAALVAFSRIYLSQHFIEDTLAGSAIGILGVILIIPVINHYKLLDKNYKNIIPSLICRK